MAGKPLRHARALLQQGLRHRSLSLPQIDALCRYITDNQARRNPGKKGLLSFEEFYGLGSRAIKGLVPGGAPRVDADEVHAAVLYKIHSYAGTHRTTRPTQLYSQPYAPVLDPHKLRQQHGKNAKQSEVLDLRADAPLFVKGPRAEGPRSLRARGEKGTPLKKYLFTLKPKTYLVEVETVDHMKGFVPLEDLAPALYPLTVWKEMARRAGEAAKKDYYESQKDPTASTAFRKAVSYTEERDVSFVRGGTAGPDSGRGGAPYTPSPRDRSFWVDMTPTALTLGIEWEEKDIRPAVVLDYLSRARDLDKDDDTNIQEVLVLSFYEALQDFIYMVPSEYPRLVAQGKLKTAEALKERARRLKVLTILYAPSASARKRMGPPGPDGWHPAQIEKAYPDAGMTFKQARRQIIMHVGKAAAAKREAARRSAKASRQKDPSVVGTGKGNPRRSPRRPRQRRRR